MPSVLFSTRANQTIHQMISIAIGQPRNQRIPTHLRQLSCSGCGRRSREPAARVKTDPFRRLQRNDFRFVDIVRR